MPGSSTTPGHPGARVVAPVGIAFHTHNSVGTRDIKPFAAHWLAYALPYRRFAIADARLGADVVRYSFIVADFHRLLLAGFAGALWGYFCQGGPASSRACSKAPHYSITSSARPRIAGGMVMPSALAVLRLIISWYWEACSTGRSAGFEPLRILSMYVAARRCRSTKSGA
jgi:hypothetical protein